MKNNLAFVAICLAAAGALLPAFGEAAGEMPNPAPTSRTTTPTSPAEAIASSLGDVSLRLLVHDVLQRNPDLAVLEAGARAAAHKAPQVRALPDPVLATTLFIQTPETRTGSQYVTARLSQRFPWFGKLSARERVALATAAAARARVEAKKVELVTTTRRLADELGFLGADERQVRADRATLAHYEELARARYATGVGIAQGVVKIQAEITRDDARLLEIAAGRVSLVARINALRDRAKGTPVPRFERLVLGGTIPPEKDLRAVALANRPEVAAADALISAAEHRTEVASINAKPDVTLGVSYAVIAKRDDRAGRLNPPQDNGKDVVGLFGAINLPVHREKLAAGVEEAIQQRLAAEQQKRAVIAGIEGALADLTARLDLIGKQIELFEKTLIPQAQASLRSAEDAYAAGRLNALDLLDAERVLFEVRVATRRAQTDWAIAWAQLEGTIAAPLPSSHELEMIK